MELRIGPRGRAPDRDRQAGWDGGASCRRQLERHLLNGLLAYHAGGSQAAARGIVHRLDMDTSGLMLVGKTGCRPARRWWP